DPEEARGRCGAADHGLAGGPLRAPRAGQEPGPPQRHLQLLPPPGHVARAVSGAEAAMPTARSGFVGLGMVGGGLAPHPAQHGYAVTGHDVSPERGEAAAAAGVSLAPSPGQAAAGADVVMSSLPHPAAVRQAYLGPDGVVAAARPAAVLVDMST